VQIHVDAAEVSGLDLLVEQRRGGVFGRDDEQLGTGEVQRGHERSGVRRIGGRDPLELAGVQKLRQLPGRGGRLRVLRSGNGACGARTADQNRDDAKDAWLAEHTG
jgi:hypothetical protein